MSTCCGTSKIKENNVKIQRGGQDYVLTQRYTTAVKMIPPLQALVTLIQALPCHQAQPSLIQWIHASFVICKVTQITGVARTRKNARAQKRA